MSRTSGPATRDKIIFEAFMLFGTKQYDDVTFLDLERATGLTRGAVVYHFKNKQDLFNAVVENNLLLSKTSVLNVPVREKDILKSFIEDYTSNCEIRKRLLTERGINNVSLAYYIIESSAFCFFEDFGRRFRQMRNMELDIWTRVVRLAMEKKEITDRIQPYALALLFMNQYTGHIYTSTKDEAGCDTEQLRKELFALYDLVKIR